MAAPRTVTVVVPVLDDAEDLRVCLAALARQTRPADEVVVVDNGSRDDSVAVALAAGARVLHEPVRGIAAAASRAYDAATGDVIARVDADTVVPDDWLARALPWFDDDLVTAVTGPGAFRDLGPVAAAFWQVVYMRAYFVTMTAALGQPPLFGSNALFRRVAWLAVRHRVHRTDPGVHDDVDLSLQFDPRWRTVLDRSLVVSVSGGPVRDPRGFGRRTRRAVHTFAVAGLRAVPPARLLRRGVGSARLVPVRVVPVRARVPDYPADVAEPVPAGRVRTGSA
ncbi:glycosyl transferase family 2 [Curtobacterium sp. 'Ferrero']|uniref:glycosyltransferase family 2 protein n=1 Tax=Curtobacterium sp. 'Ferrero' TaxID=2033654 RepID=UPI000BCE2D1A|nr:glycosyltransferase family 2 protein [Curtobacterium sp. 'Ferrero']PCN47263.1 glycosyl transferase family 2 [Curtobacterium sp. 'Ferrero']